MIKSWYYRLKWHYYNDIVIPYNDIKLSLLKLMLGEKVTLKTCENCGHLNCTCETLEEFEAGFTSYIARVNQELVKYDFPEDREAEFQAKMEKLMELMVYTREDQIEPAVIAKAFVEEFHGVLKEEYRS